MKIHKAQIEWKNNLPYSTEYEDIYFSPKSGVEESKFVFINGNNLFKSWEERKISAGNIVEIGFGTGLNFLLTWQKFREDCLNNNDHNANEHHDTDDLNSENVKAGYSTNDHANENKQATHSINDNKSNTENKEAKHPIKILNYFSIEKFPLNKK